MRASLVLLLLNVAVPVWPASAQSGTLRLGTGQVRVERIGPLAAPDARDGIAWTLDAAFGVGPVALTARYLEGALSGDGATTDRDIVEGELFLWVTPWQWIGVGAGPHVRAYVETGGTERWTMWELRGQGSARLSQVLVAYGELWTVVGSGVPVAESLDRGMGLEGGLRIALGRLPFSARVRYRVERLTLGDGARRETIEQLGIAIGVGRR